MKRGPSRFDDEIWVRPPAAARKAAAAALDVRDSLPPSRQAGTAAGRARARSIVRGELQPAREVWGWFARHRGSIVSAEDRGLDMTTSKALQAAGLWGGEAMARAASRAVYMSRVFD